MSPSCQEVLVIWFVDFHENNPWPYFRKLVKKHAVCWRTLLLSRFSFSKIICMCSFVQWTPCNVPHAPWFACRRVPASLAALCWHQESATAVPLNLSAEHSAVLWFHLAHPKWKGITFDASCMWFKSTIKKNTSYKQKHRLIFYFRWN